MRDLNFDLTGCEPVHGPRAVVVTARRGIRRLLRPMFGRLVEILASVVSRLDRAEALIDVTLKKIDAGGARLDSTESRLDVAERTDAILDRRTDGLASHLAGLNDEHLALHSSVRRLHEIEPRVIAFEALLVDGQTRLSTAETEIHAGKVRLGRAEVLVDLSLKKIDDGGARLDRGEVRLDTAERDVAILHTRTDGLAAHLAGLNDEHLALLADVQRLQDVPNRMSSFEWHVAVLHPRTEGLAAHLAGLSDDHRSLYTEVQARIVQISALSETVSNLGRRQDELDEKIRAVHALHWDHVALARRLAAIEDLLAARPARGEGDARPSLPFPGLDDEARSRVG